MTDILDGAIIRKECRARTLRLRVRQDGSVRLTLPSRVSLAAGRDFLLSKKEWIEEAQERLKKLPPRLLVQGGHEEYQATKEKARERVMERVAFFETVYGVTARSLSIRNQRTRFGSCSARGHLSFNYRLLFLPDPLFEYVIVHEVCHLVELNHSRNFWSLVARTIPDYQKRKRELLVFFRPEERSSLDSTVVL